MTKPLATAILTSGETVRIIKSKAAGCTTSFYAPTWRPMAFRTIEGAVAKMQRHPQFAAWA